MKNSISILSILCFFTLTTFAQSPTISKVEPPNWWTGMKWNTVQLMLYGQDLAGITASTEQEGLQIKAVHTLPNSTYAFVDLEIAEDLEPGTYPIKVTGNGQSTIVNYSIQERADTEGRHQGYDEHDVIYLITPDRFANGDPSNDRVAGMRDELDRSKPGMRHGGDLKGIIDHLDYLDDLGVTTLWLNPVLENSGRGSYHGYAATDLYKIDARFGSNEDYKKLVEECHQRGMKVIFDHVNNHIGIEHEWMDNLPMKDWVNGSKDNYLTDRHYKYSIFDPNDDGSSAQKLRDFWFSRYMPDMNQRNPYVANYLTQNMIWWIEYTGLDGVREDTYPYPDQHFLADWNKALLEEYPNLNIVGEIWNPDPVACAIFQTGSPLSGQLGYDTYLPCVMDFPMSDVIRDYLRGERLEPLYYVFAQDFLYGDPRNVLTFLDNHDMPRAIFETAGKDWQSKNQKIKQALTILMTTRGIPQILYATEINMKGGASHVELRADFPGGWKEDTRSAFTAEGRTEEENDLFNFTRKLLNLRKEHKELVDGRFIQYSPTYQRNIYKYLKLGNENRYLMIVNGHEEAQEVDLSDLAPYLKDVSSFKDLLSDRRVVLDQDDKVKMEGLGVYILQF